MRDIFDEIFETQPANPMERARRNMRAPLRKRFYQEASVGEQDGHFAVLLDGKSVYTPLRRPLAAPSRALAQIMADEWTAQGESIDSGVMPLTRLANAIIDAVADAIDPVRDDIVSYLGSDLVCYRADTPDALIAFQSRLWDPVLAFACERLGARFVLVQGVMHAAQPEEAIAAAARAIPSDPWRLGALSSVTALTGSALIALAFATGALIEAEAWAAAHADEDFQMSQWGRDDMALSRRAARHAEFKAAAAVLRLV